MGIECSLVIPCYNEARNMEDLFLRCRELTKHGNIEVIIVDNGSTDKTKRILNNLIPKYKNIRSLRVEKNQGYGFGILSGLKEAKGNIIGWTHADLQTDPCDVLEGLKKFKKYGYDIFVKGKRNGRPLADIIFSVGMGIFETILLRTFLWEINAQPTLFPKEFFAKVNNPPSDFSLDLYMYYRAKMEGLKVHRFPVFFGKRIHGKSRWNINWKAKLKFIYRTIKYSFELRKRLEKWK